MSAVEIIGLTKDYLYGFWRRRFRRALDHLSLRVEAGEVFGLLGPNGAGKTTTLKLLLRLIYPTAGTARILGYSIDDIEVHRRVGYKPRSFSGAKFTTVLMSPLCARTLCSIFTN